MESVLTNESEISLNQTIETLHNLRVAHTGWQDILDEFDDLITFAPYSNEGVGMMIIGESGVGKTTLLKAIKARFPEAQQQDDRTLVPCPLVSIPSRPTIKSVAQATLAALGDPLAGVGGQTTVELTSRIVCLAKGCESRALLFDEANHFVDGRRGDSLLQISDWFKELSDQCEIPFVLCGLPRSEAILECNVQLRRRFSTTLELSLFDQTTDKLSLTRFTKVIKAICSQIPMLSRSNLLDRDTVSKLFVASDGRIGPLVKLLSAALKIAVRKVQAVIESSVLEQAFQRAIWRSGIGNLNPFNSEFKIRRLDKPSEPYSGTSRDPVKRSRKS